VLSCKEENALREEEAELPEIEETMVERNEQGKPPPVAIYRALRQLEDVLAPFGGKPSWHTHGPDSSVERKRRFLKTSLLVRKQWQHLPETYFAPLMRLAIYEPDPSLNREFIEPALRAFGYHRVQEALLDYLEQGTLREKAGAARACYWAWLPIVLDPRPGYEEFRQFCDEDLWVRRDILFLKTFVEQADHPVQRAITSQLSLKSSDYPETYQPLIPIALDLARTHPDESICRQVEILLQRQHLDIC
jgi:hypothetical protein